MKGIPENSLLVKVAFRVCSSSVCWNNLMIWWDPCLWIPEISEAKMWTTTLPPSPASCRTCKNRPTGFTSEHRWNSWMASIWATKKKKKTVSLRIPWNAGCLIRILTLAYYSPYITWRYHPPRKKEEKKLNNQGPLFSLLNWSILGIFWKQFVESWQTKWVQMFGSLRLAPLIEVKNLLLDKNRGRNFWKTTTGSASTPNMGSVFYTSDHAGVVIWNWIRYEYPLKEKTTHTWNYYTPWN